MNHNIFGLLDALEGLILEGNRIPFSDKVVIDEKKVLLLVDKLRLVLRKGDTIVRESIENGSSKQSFSQILSTPSDTSQNSQESNDMIQSAESKSEQIRSESIAYSEYILANLQLMVTKMQKNLVNVEKSLETTRETIQKSKTVEDDFLTHSILEKP